MRTGASAVAPSVDPTTLMPELDRSSAPRRPQSPPPSKSVTTPDRMEVPSREVRTTAGTTAKINPASLSGPANASTWRRTKLAMAASNAHAQALNTNLNVVAFGDRRRVARSEPATRARTTCTGLRKTSAKTIGISDRANMIACRRYST